MLTRRQLLQRGAIGGAGLVVSRPSFAGAAPPAVGATPRRTHWLEHLPGPSGLENLRTLAIARLMLDNFPHVKAFWIMQTLPMAQLMLQNGADDVDGTVVWYDITKVGGASTHQEVNAWTLEKAIREAGFRPIERDTLYRRIVRDGEQWSVAPN